MTPLPKRKFSTRRTGKRLQIREAETTLANLVKCSECGRNKLPHQRCKYCKKSTTHAKRVVKVAKTEEEPKVEAK